jgi:hypothetical protein
MTTPAVIFWAVLIFTSIFWYGFLVFYLGIKAGREIHLMIKTLGKLRQERKDL